MADGFSYAEEPQTGPTPVEGGTDNTINMTTSAPILPDNVLTDRANRADFALGDKSPGPEVLKDAFKNGAEPIVRQTAATQADIDFKAQKLQQIQKMASQGAPLGAQEIDTLMALGQTPQANPNTVLEDKFADKMVSYGVAGDPANNTVFQKAFTDAVDEVQAGIQKSKSIVSRHQTYKGVLEEASAAYNDLPWVDTSGNFEQTDKLTSLAKGIFSMGFATYVNQRNLLESSPTNSILPGNNKLEQIQYLYLLPPDEGRKKLMEAAGPGSPLWKANPSDAMDFIQSAVQFGTSDAYVDNVFAIANVASLLPFSSGLKAIGRLFKGKEVAAAAEAVQPQLTYQRPLLLPPPAQEMQGPKAPGYFVPSAAVTKKDAVTGQVVPRPFTSTVDANGTPRIFNEDGVEVQLARTNNPEPGHFPVNVGPAKTAPTFTNREGTFAHTQESAPPVAKGNIRYYHGTAYSDAKDFVGPTFVTPHQDYARNYRGGNNNVLYTDLTKDEAVQRGLYDEVNNRPINGSIDDASSRLQPLRGGSIVNGKQTIYTDKKSWEKLSQVLDEEKNSTLLSDAKGYFVGDRDKQGKEIRGSRVPMSKIKTAPEEGLYPIHIPEGNDKVAFEDFGSRITRVDDNLNRSVTLGPQVVSNADVQARVALADIAKSQGETHPVDVLSKMGKHEDAAKIAAQSQITDRIAQVIHDGDPEAIRRQLPSIFSPQTYFHNAASLTAGRAAALGEMAQRYATSLQDVILNPVRVERLTAEALDRAFEIAKQQVAQRYNRASDSILDQVYHWDPRSNTYYLETRFGKKDKTLFDSLEQAKHYRDFQYRIGPAGDVTNYRPEAVSTELGRNVSAVKQEGTHFYISHIQHIDETQSGVRGSLIVSGNETPRGLMNTWLNVLAGKTFGGGDLGPSIRSSAYTMSPFQRNNRVVATHASSILKNAIEDSAKTIGKLGKTERQELQRILESNRDYMSPTGERGRFYTSAFEFETAFHGMFGKMPTEKQIVAYDQYTRLSDLDWMLRAFDLHRDKARQGIRNYKISFNQLDDAGIPSKVDSDWFNGKLVKDLDHPGSSQNANIYVQPMGKLATKFGDRSWKNLPGVDDKIKSGEYQIIQLYDPRSKPLLDMTGVKDDIHFVVVDKYKDRAIQLGEGLEYRPGGHVIYQDPFFMKQPKIGQGTNGRMTHFGDTTVKSFATEREGREWIAKYNTAREFLRQGDEAGLQAYINAGHLPETVQDFKKLFTAGGADLSTEHPFVLTATGRSTFDSSKELVEQFPGLKDEFSSYDLSQTQGNAFLAERDQQLNTIANRGTQANPIYTNVPSRLYDPYTSLQKGMQQIVRSRWMADYKMSAAESWIQEFGHLFDQSKLPMEKLRQNPIYYLYNAHDALNKATLKTNPELYTAAMVARKNVMNFVGARDEVGGAIEGLQAKLVNGIESIAGHKIAQYVSETALPKIRDATTYGRAMAFNLVDGMFNPVQIIQQGMGMAHAIAVSPINGLHGTNAARLVRMYSRTENPAILEAMFDKAVAFGWKRDELVEAHNAWKASGVSNIGGEQALLSQQADPKLFQGLFGKFVDKGQMFFKMGESFTRDVSFFTAYRDWKKANPNRAIGNREIGEIMNRFDTISLNMTRASNASYNEGLLSIPTQFWTWNARFMEQMMDFGPGKQLTLAEKARAIVTYSAIYGIPSTIGGITFGLIPYANYGDMRQYALANNLPVTEKWFQALSEGMPTVLTNMLTGHDTSFHRFSPDANQVSDILNGKKSVPEMLGGASGTVLAQIAQTVWPFTTYSINAMSGTAQSFPIHWNDITNLLENISSWNNAEKLWVGLNIGRYQSKTENFQVPVDGFESMMLGLGLNPQRVNDAYTRIDYMKARTEGNKKLAKKISEDWKIALSAGARGDYATMSDYMARVQAWTAMGDFNQKEQLQNFQRASRGVNQSLVDGVNQRWIKELPQMQSLPRMKEYLDNMAKEK